MEHKPNEDKKTIRNLARKFSFVNLFIAAFLIFAVIVVFIGTYIINSRILANVYEAYSYLLVAAGMMVLLKEFVLVYANFLSSMVKKKWFLSSLNLILFPLQAFLGVSAAYVLTENTYILYPLQHLTIASGLFYLQNLIDNNFKILNLSLVGLGIYVGLFSATYFRLLDNDIRFWSVVAFVALFVEISLFFVVTRKFLKVVG